MAESSLFWDFIVHPEKYEGKVESKAFYDKMAKSITASVSPAVAETLRRMPVDPSRKGTLIRGLTQNEVDRVAGVIRRGLEQGKHPNEIARQLTLVKDLTPQQAQTLLKYEDALKERKLSQKVINKRMETARSRLLIQRRRNIAITEASYAQGIAREREARTNGYSHKMWITRGSYNVCPSCAANEGAGVIGIDSDFPSGVVRPPAHPRCRCVCTYTNEAGIPKAREFQQEITAKTAAVREGTKEEVTAIIEDWTPKDVKPKGLVNVQKQPNYLEVILRQKVTEIKVVANKTKKAEHRIMDMALKKTIDTMDELRELFRQKKDLYIRWSRGPTYDNKSPNSRDYLTGRMHEGLSAVPVEDDFADTSENRLARRVVEYRFLQEKDEKITAFIYQADRVGTDTDNYALIADIRQSWKLNKKLIEELLDIKYGRKK